MKNVFEELERLYESTVELDTPYMLRNDGKLISCSKQMIHPYINTLPTCSKNKVAAYQFLLDNNEAENYRWFLKYSNNEKIKPILEDLLLGKINLGTIDDTLNKLRFETNQEFCRVRTSGKFLGNSYNRGIYFRISSFNFNWFDLIWNLVNENKRVVSHVTVCTDEKSKGYDENYRYRGIELNHIPVEDFLVLPGNPVIENIIDENLATTRFQESLELSFTKEN